ncbi:MAG: phosphoribosylanthranilate isomerase [Candidatus Obscuribacterales bacterium]|nr:phosphoribosylanthranilate isomerase [Candidatus Obscuribacterales bacterium]
MPSVKICGITNLDDAALAVELGAEYLGFIFAESPRQIQAADARLIRRKLADKVKFVGVFRNQDSRLVGDTADALRLDFIQLHGEESPDYCRQISHPIIKTFEVNENCEIQGDPASYSVQAYLFDRAKSQAADSSWIEKVAALQTADWQRWQPFFIAGGITAENLEHALKLAPFAIDLASGVESSPGLKDPEKLKEFFRKLQGAS